MIDESVRVCVRYGDGAVDLTLPAAMPIATVLPAVHTLAADAAIEVQVTDTQPEPDKQHDQQQGKDNAPRQLARRRLGHSNPLFYCGTGG